MDTAQISALENFLSYGPIGLAGLMLVLVVFALVLGELSDARASLLKFFMVVGGLCFLAILSAQFFERDSEHNMRVNVLPANLDTNAHIAPPTLLVNGESYDVGQAHVVADDFVFMIDLSDGVSKVDAALDSAAAELEQVRDDLVNTHTRKLSELQTEHAKLLADLRAETETQLAARDETLDHITRELEKIRAVRASLADLQSAAPDIGTLRISKKMNSDVDNFIRSLETAVLKPEAE